MNIGIFEDSGWRDLLPLTWLRPAWELRCGVSTLLSIVEHRFGRAPALLWMRPSLAPVVKPRTVLTPATPHVRWCLVNARALLTDAIVAPPVGTVWTVNGRAALIGVKPDHVEGLDANVFLNDTLLQEWLSGYHVEQAPPSVRLVSYPWQLVGWNGAELRRQLDPVHAAPDTPGAKLGQHRGTIHNGAQLVKADSIYVGDHASIKPGVVLDAEDGPIAIDEGAQLQPNAVVIGPAYIGPGSIIRPNAIIRENTSIGPVCRAGGEIEGSIMLGYCNKQHDGFLGHSYIASWVNFGAGTITSDLKNTYGKVRAKLSGVEMETGEQFLGTIAGDHTKTGIGTILPTGCILGACSNVFMHAAVPRFVPSFAWLTSGGMTGYEVDKAIALARTVMGRRKLTLSDEEAWLLKEVAILAREIEHPGWATNE
ncbi:MAG: putative sugar nucleotidyl transferase [Phycisphaerae bacterium]|nr:putative sugar nucleotidyl transferase [Phycisphaerae bacterium]